MSDREGKTTHFAQGTKLEGALALGGPALIEGEIDGEITAKDTLTIGESAVVRARITGTTVIVRGTVTGDVSATTRLELHPASRVQGNVAAQTLVIHEGARFDGQCTMGRPAATVSGLDQAIRDEIAPRAVAVG